MMVMHDFLSKRIAPLQDRSRPAWLYTGVNDTTRLEHGDGSNLDDTTLAFMLGKLSPDPTSCDFITPLASYQPLCLEKVAQMMLLMLMPLMDDIGIATILR
jgi:hypothetical protein